MELGPLQKQWIHNLKTYPERQGKHVLGAGSPEHYKACCIGELMIVCGMGEFVDGKLRDGVGQYYYPDKSFTELGLKSPKGDIRFIEDVSEETTESLAYLNDSGMTWSEIAHLIEQDPSKYFTKSF